MLISELTCNEIAEKLEKSECQMVKWSSRNERFEDLETKEKTKSGMNKAVKIVLKGQVQKRKQDEVALRTVSKLSPDPEHVHEKRWLKAPEMAETSSAQSAMHAKQRSASTLNNNARKPYNLGGKGLLQVPGKLY